MATYDRLHRMLETEGDLAAARALYPRALRRGNHDAVYAVAQLVCPGPRRSDRKPTWWTADVNRAQPPTFQPGDLKMAATQALSYQAAFWQAGLREGHDPRTTLRAIAWLEEAAHGRFPPLESQGQCVALLHMLDDSLILDDGLAPLMDLCIAEHGLETALHWLWSAQRVSVQTQVVSNQGQRWLSPSDTPRIPLRALHRVRWHLCALTDDACYTRLAQQIFAGSATEWLRCATVFAFPRDTERNTAFMARWLRARHDPSEHGEHACLLLASAREPAHIRHLIHHIQRPGTEPSARPYLTALLQTLSETHAVSLLSTLEDGASHHANRAFYLEQLSHYTTPEAARRVLAHIDSATRRSALSAHYTRKHPIIALPCLVQHLERLAAQTSRRGRAARKRSQTTILSVLSTLSRLRPLPIALVRPSVLATCSDATRPVLKRTLPPAPHLVQGFLTGALGPGRVNCQQSTGVSSLM